MKSLKNDRGFIAGLLGISVIMRNLVEKRYGFALGACFVMLDVLENHPGLLWTLAF